MDCPPKSQAPRHSEQHSPHSTLAGRWSGVDQGGCITKSLSPGFKACDGTPVGRVSVGTKAARSDPWMPSSCRYSSTHKSQFVDRLILFVCEVGSNGVVLPVSCTGGKRRSRNPPRDLQLVCSWMARSSFAGVSTREPRSHCEPMTVQKQNISSQENVVECDTIVIVSAGPWDDDKVGLLAFLGGSLCQLFVTGSS